MEKYNPQTIEKKWQQIWQEQKNFEAKDPAPSAGKDKNKKKFFGLVEFPYPSGDGLHTGHWRPYTAIDVICRKRRMQDNSVLFSIGFDAFGLPTENYAIKKKMKPQEVTAKNIGVFTNQLKEAGFSFDWERSFSTTDEDYYKWTQWIFVQMFKAGLAEKKKETINWCTSCKIGLANEEVVNGACERCGGEVIKKVKEQWVLKITKYADRLIEDLNKVDYLERIKTQQINWIGKSEGAAVKFPISKIQDTNKSQITNSNNQNYLEVFTTRPDTLFGATFMVIAPEHELVSKFQDVIANFQEVKNYIEQAKKKSDLERTDLNKEKTGVELKGIKAINPVNGKELPIFVADYVMMGYGTGAIMAVPAHDERDFEFAKKYNLGIVEVIKGGDITKEAFVGIDSGEMINSEFLNGLKPNEAIGKMIEWLQEKNIGKKQVQYKLHDWIFSRQRYWGEPIPMVYCEKCAQKKITVLLVHGLAGHSQENWFPWFKEVMESKGVKVLIPDLPHADRPTMTEWLETLGQLKDKFEGDLVIVGHSLGAPAACQFIEKENLRVKKLILVAPTGNNQGEENWSNLRKAGIEEEGIEVIKKFNNSKNNFDKLNQLSQSSVIYFSDNDPYIPLSVEENYKELKSEVKVFSNKGHFNESYGIREFPEILEEFPELLNKGWSTIPEKDLPVVLPNIDDYLPTDEGDSPLAKKEDWVKTKCPVCGGEARRETDVMPNWAGSNWYFIRYTDPKNDKTMVDPEKAKYWLPVDWYNGGMEHTTLHLLYSRFVWKFLYDIGAVPKECGVEPYAKRTAHGMILGEGGVKMSKSKGNVINPDEYVKKYGADTLRVYEMFMGPFDQPIAWEDKSVNGVYRFLNRVWSLQDKLQDTSSNFQINFKFQIQNSKLDTLLHQTIKKVGEDIEEMKFNTAVAQLMILLNELEKQEDVSISQYSIFIILLSPLAPHMAEELWQMLGHDKSIMNEKWPEYDPNLIKAEEFELVVQINGKVRQRILVPAEISETEARDLVMKNEKILKWLGGQEPKKIIYIKGKLVSIVV